MQTHGSPTRSGEEGTSVVDRGLESSLILSKMVKYLDGGCKDGIFLQGIILLTGSGAESLRVGMLMETGGAHLVRSRSPWGGRMELISFPVIFPDCWSL